MLRLRRCRIDLRAGGTRIGGGERMAADRRSFKVAVRLTPAGRRMVRRRGGVQARMVVRGVDSVGRVRTVRRGLTVVR